MKPEHRVVAENGAPERFQKPEHQVAAENRRAKEISEAGALSSC